jgi:hypothetical protein
MPSNKKYKTFNVYLEEEYQAVLKEHAKASDISVSQLLRNLINKYVRADSSTTKVVLNIPKEITKDSEELDKWLTMKKNALMHYFKDSSHS